MTTFNYTNILTQAVDELSESQSPIKDYSTNTKMEILYHLPNPYTR